MENRKFFGMGNRYLGRDNRRALWSYYKAVLKAPALRDQAIFNLKLKTSFSPESLGLSEDVDVLPGHRKINSACHTVLCVAHMVGERQFGGEKSFLDALEAIGNVPLNVVVAVPSDRNDDYIEELRSRCSYIAKFHYPWWKESNAESETVIANFEGVMNGFCIDFLYVNTIMLREAITAARNLGIHSAIHVRELPEFDEAICDIIGLSSKEIVDKVVARADSLIFNSIETERQFGGSRNGSLVIENTVSLDRFPSAAKPRRPLRVGMISSNLEKKGVADFFKLARISYERENSFRFVLVGPKTDVVKREFEAIKAIQKDNCNVELAGYIFDSVEAVSKCDVVLNLSNFQESFGRTLIEAMAAGKLAIAYRWGALPVVVDNGRTGFLVPFRDVEAVYLKLLEVNQDKNLFSRIVNNALEDVRSRFDYAIYASRFREFYGEIQRLNRPSGRNSLSTFEYTVVVPNYNYSNYLKERLLSIVNQTIKPKSIIFLDDCSRDNSVQVAQSILKEYQIPYKIIENRSNQGVYRQWEKGVSLVDTEYVWIAEADDRCAIDFVESVVVENKNLNIGLFYSQSRRIDSDGNVTNENNLHHTDDISKFRWLKNFSRAGDREVIDSLYYRNTIPNVSACVFKTKAIRDKIEEVTHLKYCGDWLLYCKILKDYDVAYNALSLNDFRRHTGSTTRKNISTEDYLREVVSIKEYIESNFAINDLQFRYSLSLLDKDYKLDGGGVLSETGFGCSYIKKGKRSRKRILFITTNNGSYTGGSEMLWRDSLLGLYEQGFDVGVVIKDWSPEPPFYKEFNRKGVKIIRKGEGEESEIAGFYPDLTVISTGDQDEGVAYFELLKKLGLRYCIVTHLVKQPEYWPVNKNRVPSLLEGFSRSQANFFTSENNKRYMGVRLGRDIPRAEIFYNPVDFDVNDKVAWPEDQVMRLAMPSRIIKVHKGHDLLVEVMKKDKWKNRNVIINIYGSGPDEDWLRRQIAEHEIPGIRLKGKVNDLRVVWGENHGIFMPSYMEGLPIVLVGAMLACRVPVVTNVGGNAEIIEDGSGFIAGKPTVEDVERVLDDAYGQFFRFKEIGKKARASVLKKIPLNPVDDFNEKLKRLISEG